jgi:hypothetical protein
MNIDQRLEALTHTVELLAGMQVETEKEMKQLTIKMSIMTDTVNRLGIAMEDHEHRIRRLEGD